MRYSLLILTLIAGLAGAAQNDYTVKQGVAWKGVKIGSQSLNGADFICRQSECYSLVLIHAKSSQRSEFGIKSLRFSELQKVATGEQDGRIILPQALGRDLFQRSRAATQLEYFFDAQ